MPSSPSIFMSMMRSAAQGRYHPGVLFVPHQSARSSPDNRCWSAPRGWTFVGLLAACIVLAISGCGGQSQAGSAAPTPSQTAVMPATSPSAETPTPVSTASPDSSGEPSDTEPSEDPSEGESDKPPVLDKNATGRDLTTADFFGTPEEWRDGRFNVAGKQALAGIAGPLGNCEEQASDSTATIELRLANNFSRVSMKVGQSDDSESSDAVVYVKVLGNGKYLDSTQVAFNKIQPLDASVVDVNALKIQVWRGGDRCNYSNSTEAVLMELRVE
jgi:hypothetical protein